MTSIAPHNQPFIISEQTARSPSQILPTKDQDNFQQENMTPIKGLHRAFSPHNDSESITNGLIDRHILGNTPMSREHPVVKTNAKTENQPVTSESPVDQTNMETASNWKKRNPNYKPDQTKSPTDQKTSSRTKWLKWMALLLAIVVVAGFASWAWLKHKKSTSITSTSVTESRSTNSLRQGEIIKSACQNGFFSSNSKCLKCNDGSNWNGTHCVLQVLKEEILQPNVEKPIVSIIPNIAKTPITSEISNTTQTNQAIAKQPVPKPTVENVTKVTITTPEKSDSTAVATTSTPPVPSVTNSTSVVPSTITNSTTPVLEIPTTQTPPSATTQVSTTQVPSSTTVPTQPDNSKIPSIHDGCPDGYILLNNRCVDKPQIRHMRRQVQDH